MAYHPSFRSSLHSDFTKEPIPSELLYELLLLWPKKILAHPPTCAPPLNKLAGSPMPCREVSAVLVTSLRFPQAPWQKSLTIDGSSWTIAYVGLSFAQQLRWHIEAVQDLIGRTPLGAFVSKDPNKLQCPPCLCLTLTALPSPLPKDRTIRSCRIRLKTTTRNQDP